MIQKFVDRFMQNKSHLESKFAAKHPAGYADIVKEVVEVISVDDDYYDSPDPNRIHMIDDGDYQGTLLFVIAAKGYQPYQYWFVKVSYGSCSGCDTFEAIRGYGDVPTTENVADYMSLALHIVEGLKDMNSETV